MGKIRVVDHSNAYKHLRKLDKSPQKHQTHTKKIEKVDQCYFMEKYIFIWRQPEDKCPRTRTIKSR